MKLFKKTICWSMLMVLAFGMSFASCSSDDEEGEGGGSSNINACYVKIDGKQIDFKYAYYYEETEDWDGDIYKEIEIQFSTIDLLYYFKNPDKIKKGVLTSIGWIEFGEELTSGTTTNYELDIEHNKDMFFVFDDPDEGDEVWQPSESWNWYIDDWDKEKTPLSITKSGSYYKMSASSVPMMASDGDDGFDSMKTYRKMTADFYFDGTPIDVSNIATYSKSVNVVKVDKPTMQWLKKIRKNN